jgi:antitoxin ParD1/3/4
MASLNITLTPDLAIFVESEIAAGGYTSVSEVVCDALFLLQQEKDFQAEKLEILRYEIGIGLQAASAGHFSEKTVSQIADEVRREFQLHESDSREE